MDAPRFLSSPRNIDGFTPDSNAEFAELNEEYAEDSRVALCVLFVFTLRTLRSKAGFSVHAGPGGIRNGGPRT
jgi:hypothetical protein